MLTCKPHGSPMVNALGCELCNNELAAANARIAELEDDLREYRNLADTLMEGNRSCITLASDLLISERRIAELEARCATAENAAKQANRDADTYARAWQRELGSDWYGKSHHIDACVVSTQRLKKSRDKAVRELHEWKSSAAASDWLLQLSRIGRKALAEGGEHG